MADRLLYWASGSGPARRAQICLKEKNLECESKELDFAKGELKGPDVIALNPRGQVPTFRDGDIVINESLGILQYLEETYPEPPLLPKDKQARVKAIQRMHESGNLLTKMSAAFMHKFRGTGTEEEFKEKVEDIKKELAYWEGYLEGSDYLAGSEFSLADVAFGPFVSAATLIGATFAEFPNIKKYVERVNERPSFTDTVPAPFDDPKLVDMLKDTF